MENIDNLSKLIKTVSQRTCKIGWKWLSICVQNLSKSLAKEL